MHHNWNRVGQYGAVSAAAEIGMGSLVHTLNVPYGGHMMANLQGLLLGAYIERRRCHARSVFSVAAISAALKSLSPSGRRFRPMFAIFTQGLLYHGAVNLLGAGLAGAAIGQALIGAWCSFQPYFLQYIFFGRDLLKSYASLFAALNTWLPWGLPSPLVLLGIWIAVNAGISAVVGLLKPKGSGLHLTLKNPPR